MADLNKREKVEKQTLYQIGYEYLRKNFHKLSQAHKIKVAISILQIFNKDDSKTPPGETRIILVTPNERQTADANRITALSI